mgnify:CR=1 FL=1
MACLLLAAKTEESPKKLVAVVQECYRLKNMSAKKSGVQKPGVKIDKRGYLDMKCEEFVRLKERVLLLERVILHTIGFELSVAHPYKLLVEQVSFCLLYTCSYFFNRGIGLYLYSYSTSIMSTPL